jgi:lycopene beta-cyclase
VTPYEFDIALVGGGLQSCLALLALAAARPAARVIVIERDAALCGNHTWCFHAGDVPAELAAAIEPAVAHRWSGYDVAFAGFARTLDAPYAAITSRSLAAAAARTGFTIATRCDAVRIGAHDVALADGRVLTAHHVIDARGPDRFHCERTAFQKFVGLELALSRPHAMTRPMLIDARLAQTDGFRFMYVLPLGDRRVLVEDTYFSDSPVLDDAAIRSEILSYAAARFELDAIAREERGVLPLPLESAEPSDWRDDAPIAAGYRGGWFHPTTGYSLPVALRVAAFIATELDRADAPARWNQLVAEQRRQLRFALRLNRMLFRWFAPAQRHHVLARFYRAPEPTVRRFYALRTTAGDRARILIGRPPRGLSLRAMFGGKAA